MKTLIFIFIFILCSTSILAQTTVPGGDVSGTWSIASSPYNVQGNITIPSGSTLNIEPGVVVIFYGNYGLDAYGSLQAIGTETDSIYFAPADTTNGWGNIEIHYSFADFSYCSVRYSGIGGLGTIRALNSSLNISHCLLSDNQASEGGAVCSWGSHVTVSNSSILRNHTIHRGGGLHLREGSYLSISNSTISYNQNSFNSEPKIGGGIYATSSDTLIVTNCIFSNNIAGPLTGNDSKGGAIGMAQYGSGGYVNISGSTFIDNSADYEGGAIYLNSTTAELNNNYFRGNSSIYEGVALSVDNCSLEVLHNIFDRNICLLPMIMQGTVIIDGNSSTFFDHCNFYNNGLAFTDIIFILSGTSSLVMKNSVFSHQPNALAMYLSGSNVSVEHCDFYNNLGNFTGSVPAGLGTISSTNTNGDPCDTFYNIFLDPLYIDPANGDFHLTENSPCIDAGDPASPLDSDGTITDMGAYYFDQTIVLDPPQNVTVEIIGTEVHLNWDTVTGATSYNVYSSNDPYIGFIEDTTGTFDGLSWSTSIINEKKFYYVISIN